MDFIRIVLLFVLAAVIYGLIHDQITARICLDYFTIGHPRMFASNSPTLHALYWGVTATWWAGLAVGILIALASRVGDLPKLGWRQQLYPAGILMAAMAGMAFLIGVSTLMKSDGWVERTFDDWFGNLPVTDKGAFLADFMAHNTSYLVGFVGGVVLSMVSIVRRVRARSQVIDADSPISADHRS